MPLYEYRCEKCRAEFTLLQPMSAAQAGLRCPKCGATETRRKLSLFASQPGGSAGRGAVAVSGPACAPGGG